MRFLIFCFILAGVAKVASGQDCSVDNPDACETAVEGIARLEVLDEECEIKVTVNSDNGVDFGTLQKPGSGSSGGGMTLNPVDESRVTFGGVKSVSGSSLPGLETLIVDYVNCNGLCGIEIISTPEVLEHGVEPEKPLIMNFCGLSNETYKCVDGGMYPDPSRFTIFFVWIANRMTE